MLIQNRSINLSDAETGISKENRANTETADTLAQCITMSSVSMVMTMQNKLVLFH